VSKTIWPAVETALALVAIAVAVMKGHEYVALVIVAGAGVLIGGHAAYERRWRRSTERMVDWLIAAAQYGTKYIQNATDHDVNGENDVPNLVARHDRWMQTVKDHAALYLQKSDEDHVAWFHTFDAKGLAGHNKAHQKVRDWTSERVDRLRFVARRLQDGTTTLKRYRP